MLLKMKPAKIFSLLVALMCFAAATHISAQEKLNSSQLAEYETQVNDFLAKGQKNDAVYYLNKIALHYWVNGNTDLALDNFQKIIGLANEIGNTNGIASAYTQIASIYMDKQDYTKSAENYAKALEYKKKLKTKKPIIEAIFNYSEALSNDERYKEALSVLEEAKSMCLELNDRTLTRNCFGRLAEIAGKSGNTALQADYFEFYKNLERELQQEKIASVERETQQKIGAIKQEASSAISQKDMQLKVTTGELIDERKINRERELEIQNLQMQNENQQLRLQEQEAKIKLQNVITFSMAAGLILLALLAFTLYRGYIQKRKSNEALSRLNKQIIQQAEEIANQNHELESKNHELTELNIEKNYIIGIVAHDLKSPLNNLKGLVDVFRIRYASENPEQIKYMELMTKSIERMKSMISRILDVNAVEQKDLNINMKEVDLGELVRSIVADKADSAANKKIHIKTEFADKKFMAKVDDEFYYQVMENLITNAIKFSPFDKSIYIKLKEKEGSVVTEIKDEGPGIHESEKSKMFKKFSKLSARPTNGESSTGLGLSIVKRYVEAMNGQVWVESEVGKGTSFFVEFKQPEAVALETVAA